MSATANIIYTWIMSEISEWVAGRMACTGIKSIMVIQCKLPKYLNLGKTEAES